MTLPETVQLLLQYIYDEDYFHCVRSIAQKRMVLCQVSLQGLL